MPVCRAYETAIESGTHQRDPAQETAVAALADLQHRLPDRTSVGAVLRNVGAVLRTAIGLGPRKHAPVTGLYLHGGVGRGKTWLMDLFYETLLLKQKRRVHFHRFMRDVHRRLHKLGDTRDPLRRVARDIARDARVLCFDEFFVSDIGDAMILGTLFDALYDRGVTLVATSNLPPHQLYRDGLQRARFLPAIAALEAHCDVIEVGAGTDFRLRALQHAPLYHHPAGPDADRKLAEAFERIASQRGAPAVIEVEGRPIKARRVTDGVVWFDFAAVCDGPRGAADYIELAHTFHTVLVSGVPQMDATLENQARRFITLVDEFYDRRVKLALSAEVPAPELYHGERLGFEFQRTLSRLQEMQSEEYLAAPHLG
ncbi:MAG: cell division protein ZapE [Xanthomonadaceae bacterium]|nr:cell division protein ZapE [Xanthomonadaceae bacterium]